MMLRIGLLCIFLVSSFSPKAAEILDFSAMVRGYVPLKDGQRLLLEDLILFPELLRPEDWNDAQFTVSPYKTGLYPASQDRYGNSIVRLELVKYGWLQRHLIQSGAAILSGYRPYEPEAYDQLKAAEADARNSRRGVWGRKEGLILQAAAIEGVQVNHAFHIVEGKVISAKVTTKGTFLNFGTDWKRDFSVLISPKNRGKFRKSGWKETELVNKWIRVRGQLRSYNGPFMEIQFPEQLEILEENQKAAGKS
ncbi:thermonuclease family protein [Sneathiella limimaris]|uniref:thermonuclease family protein n=1 Tax=Sneathiella limimaris TaxID=1964213 RepID=UPI00146EC027|nr:thermonuclease family protein [Sneathiella limimaris]